MQVRPADAHERGLDFDLSVAAHGPGNVVFDLNLLFAVEARGAHGLRGAICTDLSWDGHVEDVDVKG